MASFSTSQRLLAAVLVLVILASGTVVGLRHLRRQPRFAQDSPGTPAPRRVRQRQRTVRVQVAGEVLVPGVYVLPQGARVQDALAQAHSVTVNADLGSLNLARPLRDGERIVVPQRLGLPPTATAGPGPKSAPTVPAAPINVNTASATELEALPGIGPKLAAGIVAFRDTHGPFQEPESLLAVRGLGPRRLERIRHLIVF